MTWEDASILDAQGFVCKMKGIKKCTPPNRVNSKGTKKFNMEDRLFGTEHTLFQNVSFDISFTHSPIYMAVSWLFQIAALE